MTNHVWNTPGNTAVITGGANGIGLATAKRFLSNGLSVLVADRDGEALALAVKQLSEIDAKGASYICSQCDVSSMEEVQQLKEQADKHLGEVSILMNNAGTGLPTKSPWEDLENWKKLIEINLWGVIHGCQAFLPDMLAAPEPSLVINTGSKQGITKPPGNYAYNMSKAGVLTYTESLAHAFRQIENCPVTAHLLVPGFTYTGMISRFLPEKPDAAWTPEQLVDFMLESLQRGDFYILCPDNDVTREIDEKRIQWNTDDIIKNRPALSRWHPDFEQAFEDFMKG